MPVNLRRGMPYDPWAVVSAGVLLVAFMTMAWRRRWVSDDGFIDLRVVHNLLHGHGPVYNVGERVEAYTNPLWVGLLAVAGIPVCAGVGERVGLPWEAVILGLVSTVGALAVATWAGLRAHHRDSAGVPGHRVLPVGLCVLVAMPPLWDFATSGLETGLVLLWLGLSYAVVDREVLSRAPGTRWTPWLLGLGPLIRPDLAIYTGVFCAVTRWAGRPSRRATAQFIAAAVAPAVAMQVFRMGYFAALVPTTALAKEAAVARWSQGFWYLRNFVGPYRVALPLAVLGGWLALTVRRHVHQKNHAAAVVMAAPVMAALLHTAYIVRVGGDFMHARLLLPALFAVVLPVLVLSGPIRVLVPVALVVGAWAGVCATTFRSPPQGDVANGIPERLHGIIDERLTWIERTGDRHPILAEPGTAFFDVRMARIYHREQAGPRVLILPQSSTSPDTDAHVRIIGVPLAAWVPQRVAGVCTQLGRCGMVAGPGVHVIDPLGLADAFAARLTLDATARQGHQKRMGLPWLVARFMASPSSRVPGAADARAALQCGDMAVLQQAITAPMTFGRFMQNLGLAPRLTTMRIPDDPARARVFYCGPRG